MSDKNNKKSNNQREFKVLNDREHVLARPGMYIGKTALDISNHWIIDSETNTFKYQSVEFVPALLKCFREIIDNSIDVAIDTKFQSANKINIIVNDNSFEVSDNGIGIPCYDPITKKLPTDNPNKSCACIAWTTLKSGTSFNDEGRVKAGTNGLGSACVNVLSKKFIGESDDGKHYQKISCLDNMSKIEASKIKKSSGKSGVTVYCEPDFSRFGIDKFDDNHKKLIYTNIINLAISYPKIKFKYNRQNINVNSKAFGAMFSEHIIYETFDNGFIGVFPNTEDEFNSYSTLNGILNSRGGSHVDFCTMEICNRIRDKLVKKYKSIRPGDVKARLSVVVCFTNFPNPMFDSQTKDMITNPIKDINAYLGNSIDFDDFVKKILKNERIINPIIDMFKLKEELKARQELKKVKKIKVKSDKYIAPTKSKKYLALCEGASAMSGISSILDNKDIGYYACRGLPLNAYDSSMQKIVANAELKDIINILSLDISKSEEIKTIDFEKILITSDNDADGQHITSMLIGWFKRFAPNLFNEGKVCKLITPLIIIEDNKGSILNYFFNVQDFKVWENKNPNNKHKITYLKGLGSWNREQLIYLIDKYGLDHFILEYQLDKSGEAYIEDWLGSNPEKRKKYLREYSFDINQA